MTKCDKHKVKASYCEHCVEAAIVGYVAKHYGAEEGFKAIDRMNDDPESPTEGYT